MREHTAPTPAVARAPAVLVRLAAAQEVELDGALADGLLNGVREQHGAETEPGEARVEAGDVHVGAAPVKEAVEDGGRLVTEAERVQPQRAARGEARRGGEVEAARCLRREDAGLPPRGPAVAVQAEQLVE